MFVLVISNGYPTEKYKGLGIFELDQAKALVNAGCRVIFAAVDVRSIRRWRKWGLEHHENEGVHAYVLNIPLGRIPSALLKEITSLGLNILCKTIFKEHGKPDILHAHFTDMGYAAAKLKKVANVPLVITEHSSLINRPKIEKKLFNIASYAYKQADTVIAVSPALSNVIEKNFHIKPIYVPNIFDINLFSFNPKVIEGKFNFISTGNLIYGKRMDLTIEAFYKAFRDCTNVTLTIFGDGIEKKRLEAQIVNYKLQNRVFLKGMCKRETIAEKFKDSDCFVLASQSETFGVAYIEALACGIPVIATKCGGPEEFVHENNGRLVAIDDLEELADAMSFMYKFNSKYNRQRIAEETKELFSPKTVSKQLIEIYKTITNVESRYL